MIYKNLETFQNSVDNLCDIVFDAISMCHMGIPYCYTARAPFTDYISILGRKAAGVLYNFGKISFLDWAIVHPLNIRENF